jgi:hypothetical protein
VPSAPTKHFVVVRQGKYVRLPTADWLNIPCELRKLYCWREAHYSDLTRLLRAGRWWVTWRLAWIITGNTGVKYFSIVVLAKSKLAVVKGE